MKCYLHIGTEKTATTTLQSFFNINRIKLAKQGCLYTKSAGETTNLKLPIAAYDINRRDDLTKIYNIYTDENLSSFQNEIKRELNKEIKSASKPKVVFSAEHIQSRLTEISEIIRLKKILLGLGMKDISVILYLRNPPEIANSLYSTAIIYGRTIRVPPSPSDSYFNNICNHKRTIEKFANVFGRQKIIPRIFDYGEFKNGSVIEDFMDIIDIPFCDNYIMPTNQNKSLSVLGLELLRRVNIRIPQFIDNKLNPLRDGLVNHFQKHYTENNYFMPKQLYDEYELEFKESNEWVRKNWFPDKQSLFTRKDFYIESEYNISNKELDQIADMITDIWISKKS